MLTFAEIITVMIRNDTSEMIWLNLLISTGMLLLSSAIMVAAINGMHKNGCRLELGHQCILLLRGYIWRKNKIVSPLVEVTIRWKMFPGDNFEDPFDT